MATPQPTLTRPTRKGYAIKSSPDGSQGQTVRGSWALFAVYADRPFDQLAAVLFDSRFRVMRGAIIPYEVVLRLAAYLDSVKGWRFMLRDGDWNYRA